MSVIDQYSAQHLSRLRQLERSLPKTSFGLLSAIEKSKWRLRIALVVRAAQVGKEETSPSQYDEIRTISNKLEAWLKGGPLSRSRSSEGAETADSNPATTPVDQASDLLKGVHSRNASDVTLQIRNLTLQASRTQRRQGYRSAMEQAWLQFVANEKQILRYGEAVSGITEAVSSRARALNRRLKSIRIGPTAGLFQFVRQGKGVGIHLPAWVMGLDGAGFSILADALAGCGKGRAAYVDLSQANPCDQIRRRLAELAQAHHWAVGKQHDLRASSLRVQNEFFGERKDGRDAVAVIRWGGAFRGRKFAHYDFTSDEIVVSRILDSPEVEPWLVDYIVFHELLHKVHGLKWKGGRGYAHTAEFNQDERKFAHYTDAQKRLHDIARDWIRAKGRTRRR